ncbi:hypothetical protein L7F22_001893 [Adiantum nelumboides]|nr:hypothetical protein [Adiantum nelumboides]
MAPSLTTTSTTSYLPSSSPSHQQPWVNCRASGHNIQHQPLHTSNGVLAQAEYRRSLGVASSIAGRIAQVLGICCIDRQVISFPSAYSLGSCRHLASAAHKYSNRKVFQQTNVVSSKGNLHGRKNLCFHESKQMAFVPFTKSLDGNMAVLKKRAHFRILAVSTDASIQKSKNKDVAILWFKKDLRLDDHVGLSLSIAYQALLPVYIFDPYLLRGWSHDMLEALVEAVAELKLALQGVGSDLIIRCGRVKDELTSLAAETVILTILFLVVLLEK